MTGTAAEIIQWLFEQDKDKRWDIKEHRERRSLDANAYFHVLCDKLRQVLGVSMAREKNSLITEFGQMQYLPDGEPMIYKTNAPPEYILELETIHMSLRKVSEENGKGVYFYQVYRGSHTYDTKEMSRLIEGTVIRCQQYHIETATPDEIARMEALWGKRKALSQNTKE